jgi:uncharacterized protein YmfQ (DUF2313 family)
LTLFDHIYVRTEDLHEIRFGEAMLIWDTPMQQRARERFGLSSFQRDDYQQALAALLPEGAAWPREPGSVLMRLLGAWAVELERVDARAALLMAETDPASTAELLADWERVVGLPDECAMQAQTVAERRAALEGRLTSVGGQSKAFFFQLAQRLGYTVTIDEFESAAAATSAGLSFVGDEWAHTWRVNVPSTVGITSFRAGSGAAGEPLRAWSNDVIECQFNRIKPAHTRLLFAYST